MGNGHECRGIRYERLVAHGPARTRFWCGLADAAWTAIGLIIGTYLNWLIVSKRLRRYSIHSGNAITLPEFFSNRFREKNKVISTLAALFILIFFAVYAASCFVTCGKLFSTLFGLPYIPMMIAGAIFVLAYTIIGGFMAESASDFMQGIVMFVALSVIVIVGTIKAGGFGIIAFISVTPLIAIQALGIIYHIRSKKLAAAEAEMYAVLMQFANDFKSGEEEHA